MIKPMLALPMDKADITNWNDWAIEEKYDGHRLIVQVEHNGPSASCFKVTAYTRPRKHAGDTSGKSMATRQLPDHLLTALGRLPAGVYDGELLGGDTSTDVTRLDLAHTLRFVVFDIMRAHETDVMRWTYERRRAMLEDIFRQRRCKHLDLAPSKRVTCQADVEAFVNAVWSSGGEGAILKRVDATYQPGKRSRDFIKVKKLLTTVCTIIGFEATRGKVLQRGLFATVILQDEAGNETSVKTKDDAELAAFQRDWDALVRKHDIWRTANERELTRHANTYHPALGRKLRIEYQDWTPKGGYRHPRWDRWEEE